MQSKLRKSLEFYKTRCPQTGYQITPVRGLYVSGTHLAPWYIDHVITLQSWISTPCEIHDYSQYSTSLRPDSAMLLVDIDRTDPVVANYTTSNKKLQPDSAMVLTDIESIPPNILSYTTTNRSFTDSAMMLVDTETTSSTIDDASPILSNNIESVITLQQFTSSQAVITDNN